VDGTKSPVIYYCDGRQVGNARSKVRTSKALVIILMAEVTRNAPPGFILDACACLAQLGSGIDESVVVQPETLKRLRSGRGTSDDVEQVCTAVSLRDHLKWLSLYICVY
jgi:hypothetical protein